MGYRDRVDAGRRLADELAHLRGTDMVVLGLPRGGVPVAYEVARALRAPLDVIVVGKVGVPWQPELAMGAVGEDGVSVVAEDVVRAVGVQPAELSTGQERARAALTRRAAALRRERSRVPLGGRTAVVVDDGMATGSTARAACQVARAHGAARVILAVPVAAREAVADLSAVADEVVCPLRPRWFGAVGQWYDDFGPTADEEIPMLLAQAAARPGTAPVVTGGADAPPAIDEEVVVVAGGVALSGHLTVPERVGAMVVFAHGSGSSRHSPRNRYVAGVLHGAGFGTLLFDLLTQDEESVDSTVFDIARLGGRLHEVVAWLAGHPAGKGLPIGVYAASTGAAAALRAAAEPDATIRAVVSRGGRPDLAGSRLALVRTPTLLIVGGNDYLVADLNRTAQAQLRCPSRLAVVPGATHLFYEPGTLTAAARLAADWFIEYLRPARDLR